MTMMVTSARRRSRRMDHTMPFSLQIWSRQARRFSPFHQQLRIYHVSDVNFLEIRSDHLLFMIVAEDRVVNMEGDPVVRIFRYHYISGPGSIHGAWDELQQWSMPRVLQLERIAWPNGDEHLLMLCEDHSLRVAESRGVSGLQIAHEIHSRDATSMSAWNFRTGPHTLSHAVALHVNIVDLLSQSSETILVKARLS